MPQNGIPAIFLHGIKHFQTTGPPPTALDPSILKGLDHGLMSYAKVQLGCPFPGCCNTFVTSALLIFFHDLLRTLPKPGVRLAVKRMKQVITCARFGMYIYIYIYMCVYIYMYVCVCMCVCIYVRMGGSIDGGSPKWMVYNYGKSMFLSYG